MSEDRRSRAARSRGPREIAVPGSPGNRGGGVRISWGGVVGCGFRGVGWGAWAPKIRRYPELIVSLSTGFPRALPGHVPGERPRPRRGGWLRPGRPGGGARHAALRLRRGDGARALPRV